MNNLTQKMWHEAGHEVRLELEQGEGGVLSQAACWEVRLELEQGEGGILSQVAWWEVRLDRDH